MKKSKMTLCEIPNYKYKGKFCIMAVKYSQIDSDYNIWSNGDWQVTPMRVIDSFTYIVYWFRRKSAISGQDTRNCISISCNFHLISTFKIPFETIFTCHPFILIHRLNNLKPKNSETGH